MNTCREVETNMNMQMKIARLYQYTECGLDYIWLAGGVERVETPRGIGVVIKDIEGLHRAIGNMLVHEKKNLTGREFRFLRHELNCTQQHLGAIIGEDVQNIGRWERGESRTIPGSAQRLIKLLYEEKMSGNQAISEPLERLAELDELMNGDDETTTFEDTPAGWQPAELAA